MSILFCLVVSPALSARALRCNRWHPRISCTSVEFGCVPVFASREGGAISATLALSPPALGPHQFMFTFPLCWCTQGLYAGVHQLPLVLNVFAAVGLVALLLILRVIVDGPAACSHILFGC